MSYVKRCDEIWTNLKEQFMLGNVARKQHELKWH